MTHTPEPWIASGSWVYVQRPCTRPHCCPTHEGGPMCQDFYGGDMVGESMSKADAERIVACVNALAGIPTAALAEGWVAHALGLLADSFLALQESVERGMRDDLQERLRLFILAQRSSVVNHHRRRTSPVLDVMDWLPKPKETDVA